MLVNFRKGATGLMALVRDGGADPPSLARADAPVHRQRLAHLPSRKSPRRGTTRPERPRLRPLWKHPVNNAAREALGGMVGPRLIDEDGLAIVGVKVRRFR
jgi:hypothetical protein